MSPYRIGGRDKFMLSPYPFESPSNGGIVFVPKTLYYDCVGFAAVLDSSLAGMQAITIPQLTRRRLRL